MLQTIKEKARHVAQLGICLPSMHKVLVAHAYSPSTQEEGGESKLQGHSQQQRAFKASLGYTRPYLKRKKKKSVAVLSVCLWC